MCRTCAVEVQLRTWPRRLFLSWIMKQRTLESLVWKTLDYNDHVAGYALWSRTTGTWHAVVILEGNEATCYGLVARGASGCSIYLPQQFYNHLLLFLCGSASQLKYFYDRKLLINKMILCSTVCRMQALCCLQHRECLLSVASCNCVGLPDQAHFFVTAARVRSLKGQQLGADWLTDWLIK
jgi:hypothetical protein